MCLKRGVSISIACESVWEAAAIATAAALDSKLADR